MTQKSKIIKNIIVGLISISIVSGIGLFILMIIFFYLVFGDNLEEYRGKEALSRFGYPNAPVSDARGAFRGVLHEQNFYYRFNAKEDFIQKLIGEKELKEMTINSDTCQRMLNENLGRSWWNPKKLKVDKCYSDYSETNDAFNALIYHPNSGTTFWYYHNN